MRLVAEQAFQRGVQLGRVAGPVVERHGVKAQPVFRVGEYRPDHLLGHRIHFVHGRNVESQPHHGKGEDRAACRSLTGAATGASRYSRERANYFDLKKSEG
jgi:hypothetical protein